MTLRVLVILEDPTLDQYVVQPIVERLFADQERPARVEVLKDPHIRGASQALDPAIVAEIIEDNAMIDVFVLAVDRDGDRKGHEAKTAARVGEHPDKLLAVLAWQEVEVWALAVHRRALKKLGVADRWADVRDDPDAKERYWDPFVQKNGWGDTVGRGRKRAMRDLGSAWRGMGKACPEIATLGRHIGDWLGARTEASRSIETR